MGEQEPDAKPHVTLDDVWGDDGWTPSNFPGSRPIRGPGSETEGQSQKSIETKDTDATDSIAVVDAIKKKLEPGWS